MDSSSITHHIATTATLQSDCPLHQTDTVHNQVDVSSCTFQAPSLQSHLAYGVSWRSRAGELLSFGRRKRQPVDAWAYRMLCKGGVPILISSSPSFGQERSLSQLQKAGASGERQTNYFDNGEKALVVRTRDRGTVPARGGSDSRLATLVSETNGNDTKPDEFPRMLTQSNGTGDLHDFDGSKTLKTILAVLGSSRGKTIRRILSRTWEPGGRWPKQDVEATDTKRRDNLPQEQPMASGQKRRWEGGARHFLAMTTVQLGTHLAYDGGSGRIRQPWDVIELFSKDVSVSLAVLSGGG